MMKIEYILDGSAIISHPEILSTSSFDTKFIILTPVFQELLKSAQRKQGINELITRALTTANVKLVDPAEIVDIGQANSLAADKSARIDTVDALIVSYVLARNAQGQKAVAITNDRWIIKLLAPTDSSITPIAFLTLPQTRENPNTANFIGLSEYKRKRRNWIIINIFTSIFFSTIAVFAYNNPNIILNFLFYFRWIGAVVLSIFIGLAAYWLRQNMTLPYAITEIAVGVIIILSSVPNVDNINAIQNYFDAAIKLSGGLYVIVRGIDNFGKAIRGLSFAKYWDRFFLPS